MQFHLPEGTCSTLCQFACIDLLQFLHVGSPSPKGRWAVGDVDSENVLLEMAGMIWTTHTEKALSELLQQQQQQLVMVCF